MAARYPTPASERFLRSLPIDYRQTVEAHGRAYLALAELLAEKFRLATQSRIADEKITPAQRDYLAARDPNDFRIESRELLQHVLTHYADIPLHGVPRDERAHTLGERAAVRLHELADVTVPQRLTENAANKGRYAPGS